MDPRQGAGLSCQHGDSSPARGGVLGGAESLLPADTSDRHNVGKIKNPNGQSTPSDTGMAAARGRWLFKSIKIK